MTNWRMEKVLSQAVEELTKFKKMKGPNRDWKNPWTYPHKHTVDALPISIPENSKEIKMILTSKRTLLTKHRISISIAILQRAYYPGSERFPILLAWKPPEFDRISYYFFNAEWIFKYEPNVKINKTKVNFPFELGKEWIFDEKIQTVLDMLEKITKSKKSKRMKAPPLDFFFKMFDEDLG